MNIQSFFITSWTFIGTKSDDADNREDTSGVVEICSGSELKKLSEKGGRQQEVQTHSSSLFESQW
jgi:hypothetical protein